MFNVSFRASNNKLYCRCDADPGTLARYVVALIKKDRPVDDLRKQCLKKLQIFLQKCKQLSLVLRCIRDVIDYIVLVIVLQVQCIEKRIKWYDIS